MSAALLRLWLWRGVVVAFGSGMAMLAFVFGPRIGGFEKTSADSGSLGLVVDVLVPIKILLHARMTGAVCLDGTPPGLHIDRGFGTGVDSWLIYLEGGGWCDTVESCSYRKTTMLGSSSLMEPSIPFVGILSRNQSQNPDFYNWNRVKVRYCDGGSFSGNVESEVHDGERLFFRGQRIWVAVMNDLIASGLASARQALLTGCSAGGLATFIHCDDFRRRLPMTASVKCLSDAGFFLDVKDISGARTLRSFYHDVVGLHGIAGNLPKDCTQRTEPSQCFFPRELIKSITTPIIVLNSMYDYWQIQHILAPASSDPEGLWLHCKRDLFNCDANETQVLEEFRREMVYALKDFGQKKDAGFFLNSCYVHCQTSYNVTWYSSTSPRVGNKTIARYVGDWFFDQEVVNTVDCPFPCNPTCYNMRFP